MKNSQLNSRRSFLKNAINLGAENAIGPQHFNRCTIIKKDGKKVDCFTFLFHGYPITGGGRGRNSDRNNKMEQYYTYLITSRLCYGFPKKHFAFLTGVLKQCFTKKLYI